MDALHDRRTFLRAAAAAGVAWAAADVLDVEQALAWAGQQASARGAAAVSALTRAQADVVDAVTARILPSVDGRPGAREAGAVYFIDRALATFNAGQKTLYVNGLADLNRRAAAAVPGSAGFVALTASQQDELLRAIEATPFFQSLRFDTIVGTFALPTYGGNREYAGWHMIGFEHLPRFQAPFGFYDADANRRV
ncbi:MAG TPA: gluconate 2-dehydrogenase subunit 3 family protein [Vicinamibacterales bacterium]|nr:gluconate 2-dehydrogenase subunit 3 family protein [Vicinamibacterales bacterium]